MSTSTGEIIACPVLIGVLPFSGFGFAKALPDASLAQVIPALNDILNYFGGVPLNARSDNMKQWVVHSCRYEPTFPQTLEQWALLFALGLLVCLEEPVDLLQGHLRDLAGRQPVTLEELDVLGHRVAGDAQFLSDASFAGTLAVQFVNPFCLSHIYLFVRHGLFYKRNHRITLEAWDTLPNCLASFNNPTLV
ncbi:hypothetical protein VM932_02240 [Muricauda sp. SYSU M86414]|nr:hypothetical protein [Muricauda sp. SYSU M86414]MEC3964282.1 hypothetical protein [Muricauda sp. SYSU M86414]